MKNTVLSTLLAATALSTGFYGIALANEQVEPTKDGDIVVVTADKREKTIQKTSISVSVVSGNEILSQGRTKIDDVLVNQPATVVQGGSKGYLVSIRGLGLNLPAQMGQGAVSTIYDNAYSSRSENSNAGFYDLLRVEVLRGPQGTMYGRNAVGGVVNVISKDPTTAGVEGYYSLEAGNYNLFHAEGALNVPVNDKMAIRLSGATITRDGYMTNKHDDNKSTAMRAKYLWQIDDSSNVVLGTEYVHVGGKGAGGVLLPAGQQLPTSRYTNDVSAGGQDVNVIKYWANYQKQIGIGNLTIIPTYQKTTGKNFGAFGGNLGNSYDPKEMEQKSLEVRYQSLPGKPIEWSVGYYHYDNDNTEQTISNPCEDASGFYVVPDAGYSANAGRPEVVATGSCLTQGNWIRVNYTPRIRNSATDAIFGQTTIPLNESLRTIIGIRYAREEIGGTEDANFESTTNFVYAPYELDTIEDNHIDYKFGIEKDWGIGNLLYATIASGYRQGGYNNFLDTVTRPKPTAFDAEKMVSYEIGSKNKLLGGNLIFNTSLFYYDYSSYQLVNLEFGPSGPVVNITTMPATEYGAEFEFMARVGQGGKLSGSLSLLHSELGGVEVSSGTWAYKDAPFTNAPDYMFKASYSHDLRIGNATITPRIDLRFVGESLVAADEKVVTDIRNVQPAYSAGDVSLLYRPEKGDWTLNLYCKNVTDEVIKSSHFFGYAQLQAPRTYGAVFSRRF
jgi:iron complex outermembrane receptor protein